MKFSRYRFDINSLNSMIGGMSLLDIPQLQIQSRAEAVEFVKAYGYDPENEEDLQQLWVYHRKAVTYIQEELLKDNEVLPEELTDPNKLSDLLSLLIYASTRGHENQVWSCGILKVMHIMVHLDNDLFAQFQLDIQEQILKPIETCIHEDPVSGITLGSKMESGSITIKKFETKTFKSSTSSVTKLLAKKNLVAFNLLDKLGVRIITKNLFDAFRVLKYLTDEHLVSFPHNIPDQSNNTLFPLNIFMEVIETLNQNNDYTGEEVDKLLAERLASSRERASFLHKENNFTSEEFKFIKFITRRLIRVTIPGETPRKISFFYPFEVQIMDYETHLKNTTGPASHDQYKERQIRHARARIFGFKVPQSQESKRA